MVSRRSILTMLGVGSLFSGTGVFINHIKTEGRSSSTLMGESKIPNVPIVTHSGQQMMFYDDLVKNHILVMNMMYTSCSGICPLATSNLIQVHRLLTDIMPQQFIMCSLTLNPEVDDPDVLAYYVKQHQLPKSWLYLTGKPQHVMLIRKALGFFDIEPDVDNDISSHTGMLRLGNESLNRWSMMPSQANPIQIVNSIMHLARVPSQVS
ncbi:MAG: SCO family protein [Aeromonas sp.]